MNSILTQGFAEAYRDPVTSAYPLGNGYRFYLPALMRFSAQDADSPFGKGGVHAYGYCAADPINLKDVNGHDFLGDFLSFLDPVHDINQYILKPFNVKLPQWAQTAERVTRDVAMTALAIAAVPVTDGASAAAVAAAVGDAAAGAFAVGADVASSFNTAGAHLATQVLSYSAMVIGSVGVGARGMESFVRSAWTSASLARTADEGLMTNTVKGAQEAFGYSSKIVPRSSLFARVSRLAATFSVPGALNGAAVAERFTNQPSASVLTPEVEVRAPELPGGDPGGSGNPNMRNPNKKQQRILTGSSLS